MNRAPRLVQIAGGLLIVFFSMAAIGNSSVLSVDLSLEVDAKADIRIALQKTKAVQKAVPGAVEIDVPAEGNGDHYLFFSCPGHAAQWHRIEFSDGKIYTEKMKVKLYRARYVVLRCAFNPKNKRALVGPDVEEERLALPHWTGQKYFRQDWQIWQSFGETTLALNFHRISTGFGFVKPALGTKYEEMKEAPEAGYKCENIQAQKGLVLYCRVEGNRHFGLGYGKLIIEDITETPPKDVHVLKVPDKDFF